MISIQIPFIYTFKFYINKKKTYTKIINTYLKKIKEKKTPKHQFKSHPKINSNC